jgi:hypothetical protein
MKRLARFVLLATLFASGSLPAYAKVHNKYQPRDKASRKAEKQSEKAQRKYVKAQQKYARQQKKAERKMLKTERKNTTYKPKQRF